MSKERRLTCIVCPKGCDLVVTFGDDGAIENISGYTCPRGKEYAATECTAPVRTVTSTVRCADGGVVSVKTDKPVPKELLFECMTVVNAARVSPDAKVGDVVVENILGTGANVVATRNVKL